MVYGTWSLPGMQEFRRRFLYLYISLIFLSFVCSIWLAFWGIIRGDIRPWTRPFLTGLLVDVVVGGVGRVWKALKHLWSNEIPLKAKRMLEQISAVRM